MTQVDLDSLRSYYYKLIKSSAMLYKRRTVWKCSKKLVCESDLRLLARERLDKKTRIPI